MHLTATYSPDDNKLRLYASSRLDADTYARVRAAGFRFAPSQDLFVAPSWTPEREDLLLDLCGEVGDEDTALVERAEERAERFAELGGRRAGEAEAAQAAVPGIAAGGNTERILGGMQRAVSLWDTSTYWTRRAAAALRHARYKERPDVRARRIRTLEAERRKNVRSREEGEAYLRLWKADGLTLERAKRIANSFHASYTFPLATYPRQPPASQYEGLMGLWSALDGGVITAEQARELAVGSCERTIAVAERWTLHLDHRLAYERAMLSAQGGTAADRTQPEKGGACRRWASPRGGWSYIQKVNRVSVTVLDNYGNGGPNFTRTIPTDKLAELMSAAQVDAARAEGRLVESADGRGFYLGPAETAVEAAAGIDPASAAHGGSPAHEEAGSCP